MSWRELEWHRCLNAITDAEISAVEERLNVSFPPSYRECVKACHAGAPRQNVFDVADEEIGTITTGLGQMLSFVDGDDESVVAATEELADRLPDGVVLFAIEAGGDYIGFDYRSRAGQEPAVVYWSHEKDPDNAVTNLSDSFDQFIELLRRE